ncbi:MAG: hypothetical protein AB1896_19660 [Thermodesulfobacteriota bacterium]
MVTNQDFQNKVLASLAAIEERTARAATDIRDMKRTLFGEDGTGGLVNEVRNLRSGQVWWNRGLGAVSAVILAWLKWGKT